MTRVCVAMKQMMMILIVIGMAIMTPLEGFGASLWPSTTVPGIVDAGADNPVELGVRFRSDSSGSISGIRFYKSAANSGPHTARLWSSGGALLASATFSNETPSGWQQANFSAPVAINANTVYVASYHTATGHYSYNQNYFTGAGQDTPPLHALADGISGANGVFAYGSAGSFPYGGWNGSNYWVDVVFSTASVTDNIAPTVTAFSVPASSATLTVSITALNASDNIGVTGYLVTESSTPPPASHSGWSANVPVSYTFGEPGSKILHAWARDAAGNVSASSTASVTVTVSTSDGSILLISSAANPFSGYYAEILRAEGFTTFNQVDISSLTSATLAAHDLVILGEMTLSDSQASLFNSWVTGGGKLIAMRPDKKLAALFGLTNQNSGISNGYIRVDTAAAPGAGIVGETMQYHGVADLYALNGAKGVATLYSSASAATSNPAVSLHNVGSNGGQAAAFAYDLARSVVYTRQGNPAWAGQERDGDSLMRSDDLFYGPARFDPQPNWIDLGKVAIPQADEQQRLLANLMIHMNMTKKPLPRFWYLPRNLAAAVVMTGDDHGEGLGGTKGRFNLYQYISRPGCSVDNWECIRGSSYIYTANSLTNTEAAAFNGAGFEIGLHVNTNCANWTPASLNSFYDDQLASFGAKYPGVPAPVTNRTHCIAWSDYTSQSSIELAHNIRLDTSYYYWPPHWVANNPGFFTGSGMPMRFANADGTLIDVYQAATQMTDESGQSYPFTVDSLLDNALGPEGFYGTFVVNAHTDFDNSSVSESVIESARVRDVPVISARQLLKWTDGRNASSFNALTWNGTTLGFSLTAGPGTSGLTAMVPIPAGRSVTGITRNGYAVEFAAVVIKGVAYARFGAPGGSYQVSYSLDTAAPEISSITPAEGAGNVELFTHVTATFNKPVDPNTVHSGTFRLHDPSSTVVEASVELNTATNTAILIPTSPLRGSTTYSVTVYGGSSGVKDLAGNALASSMTWSFTTRQVSTGATSIWPASRVPSTVDAGADSPVELGVKFRSDKSGYITGIRFYKSAANTGTHTASLWSAGGTRMATTTFGGETASGWQQVNFSNPVAITANTVYVASYHTNVGHYSYDDNFFQGKGVDNPPLHALADGVSGSNGVFAYGSGSNFPNQGWNSSNYWVDVVFSETSGQNLFSGSSLFDGAQPVEPYITMISVTPDNQRIAVGTTQQFSAVATYSNGRTEDVSNKVSWASSAADVVTVSSTGLVTAHGPGTSTITVTLNGITGTTTTTATVGMARLLTVLRTDIM